MQAVQQSMERRHPASNERLQVYTVCLFGRNFVVPEVQILEAPSDESAIAEARTRNVFSSREVWKGHRLLAVIPPNGNA